MGGGFNAWKAAGGPVEGGKPRPQHLAQIATPIVANTIPCNGDRARGLGFLVCFGTGASAFLCGLQIAQSSTPEIGTHHFDRILQIADIAEGIRTARVADQSQQLDR